MRIRAAAERLQDTVWIAVTLPNPYEEEDDLLEDAAITRWTTVALHLDDLDWIRESFTTS